MFFPDTHPKKTSTGETRIHESSIHPRVYIEAMLSGCRVVRLVKRCILTMAQWDPHRLECPSRHVVCEQCDLSVVFSQVALHQDSKACSARVIEKLRGQIQGLKTKLEQADEYIQTLMHQLDEQLEETLPCRGRVSKRSEPGWGAAKSATPPRLAFRYAQCDPDPPPAGEGEATPHA